MTIDASQFIENINAELQSQADPSYRELVRNRYNMNVDNFMGVRTPVIHRIAGKHYKTIKARNVDQRLEMCQLLLETRVYEEKIVAFRWAHLARREYLVKHLEVFANWLNQYVDDWIDCDDLSIHVLGEFFVKYPVRADEVVNWTRSPNKWVRRGAAVSLVLPARRGQQLQLTLDIADLLLDDPEDIVHKAYGWLLKEASKIHAQEVFNYVKKRKDVMPRVAFRYSIEKLPEQLRRKAIEKA